MFLLLSKCLTLQRAIKVAKLVMLLAEVIGRFLERRSASISAFCMAIGRPRDTTLSGLSSWISNEWCSSFMVSSKWSVVVGWIWIPCWTAVASICDDVRWGLFGLSLGASLSLSWSTRTSKRLTDRTAGFFGAAAVLRRLSGRFRLRATVINSWRLGERLTSKSIRTENVLIGACSMHSAARAWILGRHTSSVWGQRRCASCFVVFVGYWVLFSQSLKPFMRKSGHNCWTLLGMSSGFVIEQFYFDWFDTNRR